MRAFDRNNLQQLSALKSSKDSTQSPTAGCKLQRSCRIPSRMTSEACQARKARLRWKQWCEIQYVRLGRTWLVQICTGHQWRLIQPRLQVEQQNAHYYYQLKILIWCINYIYPSKLTSRSFAFIKLIQQESEQNSKRIIYTKYNKLNYETRKANCPSPLPLGDQFDPVKCVRWLYFKGIL